MTINADPIPFRVELSKGAQRTARGLADSDWEPIRKNIARVAVLAGRAAPPPKRFLETAGFHPPLFRLPAGRHLVLYDFRREERVLYVLAIMKTSPSEPHPLRAEGPARAA